MVKFTFQPYTITARQRSGEGNVSTVSVQGGWGGVGVDGSLHRALVPPPLIGPCPTLCCTGSWFRLDPLHIFQLGPHCTGTPQLTQENDKISRCEWSHWLFIKNNSNPQEILFILIFLDAFIQFPMTFIFRIWSCLDLGYFGNTTVPITTNTHFVVSATTLDYLERRRPTDSTISDQSISYLFNDLCKLWSSCKLNLWTMNEKVQVTRYILLPNQLQLSNKRTDY